jgi:hypothetical protein
MIFRCSPAGFERLKSSLGTGGAAEVLGFRVEEFRMHDSSLPEQGLNTSAEIPAKNVNDSAKVPAQGVKVSAEQGVSAMAYAVIALAGLIFALGFTLF